MHVYCVLLGLKAPCRIGLTCFWTTQAACKTRNKLAYAFSYAFCKLHMQRLNQFLIHSDSVCSCLHLQNKYHSTAIIFCSWQHYTNFFRCYQDDISWFSVKYQGMHESFIATYTSKYHSITMALPQYVFIRVNKLENEEQIS